MKIPKSVKKQVRGSFKRSAETQTLRKSWSFVKGDLVFLKRKKTWGIIVETSPYRVMTPIGYLHVSPSHLKRIQPL